MHGVPAQARREWRQTQLRSRSHKDARWGMHSGVPRLGGAERQSYLTEEANVTSR